MRADYIEYDEETKDLVARGNVYFHGFEKNEQIWCDHLEYNREDQKGKFYDVRGESMPKVVVRRGILSGNSPFHFEGEWAERVGDKYILYDGWITNCKMPNPWWKMRGPKFDIIPGDRAKAYKSWFILRSCRSSIRPTFITRSKNEPRHSGFLIPNLVPRSQRGFMVGLGYFWAINRSYDLTYRSSTTIPTPLGTTWISAASPTPARITISSSMACRTAAAIHQAPLRPQRSTAA